MGIKARIIFLIILLVLVITGVSFLYLWLSGKIKIGADAVVGCQNSKKISAFFGSPGSHLTGYDFFGNQITVNELLTPYLDEIQKEIKAANINYSFDNVQSFNLRSKRHGGGLSLHSWGIAIDINPDRNPYQRGNYGPPQTDIPGEVIEIFKKYGFFWGGDWPGERDAMHFEWYGSSLTGDILDKVSSQKILSVATAVNGSGSPNTDGSYYWIIPYGIHNISAEARGYQDSNFPVELTCFSQSQMDIAMDPLPSNVPGALSGKVKISGNYPVLFPANIYLDGRLVSISNVTGDYYIPNVHTGKHQISAKIMFFPGGATTAEVLPGDDLKDVNILIGK